MLLIGKNIHIHLDIIEEYFNLECWSVQDVDYEATLATKLSIARKMFNLEKDLILKSSSFQKFFSENEVL